MGKIISFQRKSSSTEEEDIALRLRRDPYDLEALTKLLVLKTGEGKFDPQSAYAKRILQCLKTKKIIEVDQFLSDKNLRLLIEQFSWYESSPEAKARLGEFHKQHGPAMHSVLESFKNVDKVVSVKREIRNYFFSKDTFLDDVYLLVPEKKTTRAITPENATEKRKQSVSSLKGFFIRCFEQIIATHGLTDEIICILGLCKDILSHSDIKKLVLSKAGKVKNGSGIEAQLQRRAEKIFTSRFRKNELTFIGLYKLLMLRVDVKKETSDVCNAIIAAIPMTKMEEIETVFDTRYDILWGFQEALSETREHVNYVREPSKVNADFMADFLLKLHDNNMYNTQIAFNAKLFFSYYDIDACPVEYLVLSAIYAMDEIIYDEAATDEFFVAGMKYADKKYYREAMTCIKASLFNAIFMAEDPLDVIGLDKFIELTRKLSSYQESINFLSAFKTMREHGFSLNQAFFNEIEVITTELEYELESRQYHKIDEFYELVAKDDYPAIQSHLAIKDHSKFVLTGNQLHVLLKKLQERADIILSLKSINAKCDMMMYINREVYDKQSAILAAMKENQDVIEDLITRHTEKIIENIHEGNERLLKQVNFTVCQEFYQDVLGIKLWTGLDEGTKKYLILGRHLDVTNQYSVSDEYGFIAIEYALAIENEFKKKLIDNFLSREPHIKYRTADKIKVIAHNSKVTLGEICLLLDKAFKVKTGTDLLWSFSSFVAEHSAGGKKVFELKNALFNIKDKYRNPAAHPSNYSRELLNSFKELLFDKGFIKKYLESIQIVITK